MKKPAKKSVKKEKHSPNEKPISLAGAKFEDVLKALLKTKPVPPKAKAKKNG